MSLEPPRRDQCPYMKRNRVSYKRGYSEKKVTFPGRVLSPDSGSPYTLILDLLASRTMSKKRLPLKLPSLPYSVRAPQMD